MELSGDGALWGHYIVPLYSVKPPTLITESGTWVVCNECVCVCVGCDLIGYVCIHIYTHAYITCVQIIV